MQAYTEQNSINLLSVLTTLKYGEVVNDIGGVEKLFSLMNKSYENLYFNEYLNLIIEKYIRRLIIKHGAKLISLGYSTTSLNSIFSIIEENIYRVIPQYNSKDYLSTSQLLLTSISDIGQQVIGNKISGRSSGFSSLDAITQGFQASDLIIIAGRPSMGKTAFAINIAYNIAKNESRPIIVFSLEMSKVQLIYRVLSLASNIPATRLKSGRITLDDWDKLLGTVSKVAQLPIYLDDSPNLSVSAIKAKAKKFVKQELKTGAIIIDYLQLISSDSLEESRTRELSVITRSLKSLAKELNLPIIVLSQLSRNVDNRTNKRPLLSDLV